MDGQHRLTVNAGSHFPAIGHGSQRMLLLGLPFGGTAWDSPTWILLCCSVALLVGGGCGSVNVRRLAGGSCWCGRQELNLHIFRYQLLRLARLPIPPRPQGMTTETLIARTTHVVAISQESPMLRNYEAQGT